MLTQIQGLHHVTAMAKSAPENNAFFAHTLGLRRVKQTVNFDEPSVYHLYYGDEAGTPGSVMTYFPFPHIARGKPVQGTSPGSTAEHRGRRDDCLREPSVAGLQVKPHRNLKPRRVGY